MAKNKPMKSMDSNRRQLIKQANKLLREKGVNGEEYTMPRQPGKVRYSKQERKRQKKLWN